MLSNILNACRSSLQLKLFLSLTAIVALSLAAILASQVYLVQDYFDRQAETNLRNSNYLLGRVLADPLFERDPAQLQARLQDVQTKLPLCNFQLRDNIGRVVFKVGEDRPLKEADFDPNGQGGCYSTVVPVVRGNQLLGTASLGIRTDEIAKARRSLIQDSVIFAVFWFVLFMLPFFAQIRRLLQPLSNLSQAAQQLAKGNLNYPALELVHGDDEISRLHTSFRGMAHALARNRDKEIASLAELNNERSALDALLTTMTVGVVYADHSHIRYCNAAFSELFQIDPDEQLAGLQNDELLLRVAQHVAGADSFLITVSEMLQTRTQTAPIFVPLRDGRILRLISSVVLSPDNKHCLGRFWLCEDVTEERKMTQLAEMHAEHDALTMLYNRYRFDEDLQRDIAQAERDGSRLALLIFDLDDFRVINEVHGHDSGDIVLKQIALTLSTQLRRNEVLYRIGGDEFALLLVNASDEEVTMIAGRIVKSIHSLIFNFNGATAKVGCSLVIARYPRDAKTLPALMQLADQAMQATKVNGKGQFGFISNCLQAASGAPQQPSTVSSFDEMSLGISILDAQHKAMANFIHGILDSLVHGDKSVKMHKRVEMLVELCQIHFQTEEDLMKSYDLPGLNEHRVEHHRQLKNLRALFGKLNFKEQDLPKVTHDLNDWLMDHIAVQDAELAAELKSRGVT